MAFLDLLKEIELVSKVLPSKVLLLKTIVVLHHVSKLGPFRINNGLLFCALFGPLINHVLNGGLD